jgi:hypothetical protein
MFFTNICIIKYLHPYKQQIIINLSIYNHQNNHHHDHHQHLTPQRNDKFQIHISPKRRTSIHILVSIILNTQSSSIHSHPIMLT